MNKLKIIYKDKNIDFNNITEKEIIYFCRSDLNVLNHNKEDRKVIENEICDILKSKNWDWFYKDIDNCNLLLYPIYNKSFLMVNYLLENNKYDLSVYNKDVSFALSSSILLNGKEMLEYIISKNLHTDYITDLTVEAYNKARAMSSVENIELYLELASLLIEKQPNFESILERFIKNREESSTDKYILFRVLDDHKLHFDKKVKIIDDLLFRNNFSITDKKVFLLEDKIKIIDNWKVYNNLNENLKNNSQNKVNVKI